MYFLHWSSAEFLYNLFCHEDVYTWMYCEESETNSSFFLLRYHQRSVSKLAGCFATTSATDITALSAINDFFSRILLPVVTVRTAEVFQFRLHIHRHFPCHPQQFVYGVFRCCPRASIVDSTCEWMRLSVVYLGMWGIWGFTMHLFSNKSTNKRSSQEQFCSTLVHFALPCTEQKEYAYRVMTYVNMQIYI